MRGKVTLLLGFGTGYVLGSRSGRERYDQMSAAAHRLWHDPRVQARTEQAQHVVQERAGQAGHVVQEKVQQQVTRAGHAVKQKVTSSTDQAPTPTAASTPAANSFPDSRRT